jgi:hypothetical protein
MKKFSLTFPVVVVLALICMGGISSGQEEAGGGFQPQNVLVVPNAAVDPLDGDLLIVANSWRTQQPVLHRFSRDGEEVETFSLERYKPCCAIRPSLISIDSFGDIYSLEYEGDLQGFHGYKHDNNGEFDLDWGQVEGIVDSTGSIDYAPETNPGDETPEETYEQGETRIDWNAGGGRTWLRLVDPIDLIARDDGSLLILDRNLKYIFLVSPDGREMTWFIGRVGYYPERPQRMLMDSQGYIYLVDMYGQFADANHEDMVGVFKFTPDGEWIEGWGEGSATINDPWRETIDLNTLVIDGNDNMIVLGGPDEANHSVVYVYDTETGSQVLRDNVQYRMGPDDNYLGIMPDLGDGFIVLTQRDFEILVDYYDLYGIRTDQATLFSTSWIAQ